MSVSEFEAEMSREIYRLRARIAELEAKLQRQSLDFLALDGQAQGLQAGNASLRERCRTTAQLLIKAVGAEGPTDCDEAARRAVAVIAKLRAALEAAPPPAEPPVDRWYNEWYATTRAEALKRLTSPCLPAGSWPPARS